MNDNNIGTITLLGEKKTTNSLLTKGIGLLIQHYDHSSSKIKTQYNTNFYENHSGLIFMGYPSLVVFNTNALQKLRKMK